MGVLDDLGIGGLFGGISGGQIVQTLFYGIFGIGAFAVIFIFLFLWIKDKLKYRVPITAIIPKESGGFKEIVGLRGGVVKTRKGVSDFEIKIPKKLKKKRLGYVPDMSLSSADDRIYFIVVGDGMVWQQCKKEILEDGETQIEVKNEETGKIESKTIKYKLVIEPIPTDIKAITINNIHDVENLLEANKLKATTIAIGAFILMVLVHALFLFLAAK